MKIAVTFDNGTVFQHFGHTEQFKIYETENGKIVSSRIISTDGQGHGALAAFLSANGVDTLICGGIGGGAQMALAEAVGAKPAAAESVVIAKHYLYKNKIPPLFSPHSHNSCIGRLPAALHTSDIFLSYFLFLSRLFHKNLFFSLYQ